MKLLIKSTAKPLSLLLWCLMLAHWSYGQKMDTYNYQRELQGITEQWHTIVLPDAVFGKVAPDLSDLRIFGINANNDTLEAPYVLQVNAEKIVNSAVHFNTLNTSSNREGFYFTFEVPTAEAVNQIQLAFKQQNFDWRLQLEGSQTQNEWYTIVKDYRILSIKNESTDYQFTTINIPRSKYRYLRVLIDSREAPVLTAATINLRELVEGNYRTYPIQTIETSQNRQTKQTEIDLQLSLPVPLSQLNIEVLDTFDYYRPVTIQYCTDSIKTEKGWRYNYRTLSSGTLSSMEDNTFKFSDHKIARRLKILIHNQDNQALNLGTITLQGSVHQLVARFNTPATYYLTYCNKYAAKPQYDIARFPDKIPSTTTVLSLGQEQIIEQAEEEKAAPLFENKIFLWVLMLVIIVVLGGFTLKMMSGE